ncbi:4-(cytidine 5'-diphospho)-2-C-methyl-D-erythritol kinase [Pacificimonas flava]|uniref:4-diphosphocytidyl-2-C-methyl-D-erythritol kinase n=2 Tax=Pacificimonas TaxID=1960290 RepID=A0A219B9H9_9SPHN|nr:MULTISPECIES: 4-(cytidine 5'-diphospho)-2-C-methyl-D-erythritol kinase [Pacificimonas]MBZ6379902.1 4-(cytidine 5'-diphospho)-2-C-methyl-D-erythritol kinase [Pacificimonas aurantium]OWV34428.1 4-(cytidine 5'-diphospho)-2-C-methyl-D-erythritol kinase [Pacificimonas flava]
MSAAGLITERAPAKLNLALHVRRRREDGMHDLETLFAFCADGDEIVAAEAPVMSLEIEGPFAEGLAADDSNLVLRAARLLADHHAPGRAARLRLVKRLPVASGIGGGSGDAAATLRALSRLWSLDLGPEELAGLAAPLGADIPACVHSRPLWGEGAGEVLRPADLGGLAGAPLLLVNPGVAVATGPVFQKWDGEDRGSLPVQAEACLIEGRNDLEPAARTLEPVIGEVIQQLDRTAPSFPARMSGSGATCFALYATEVERDAAARALAANFPSWWVFCSKLT